MSWVVACTSFLDVNVERILICMIYYSPIVPGHEIIGHIAAVGGNVSRWSVGDRVGGGWHGGHDGMFTVLILKDNKQNKLTNINSGTCKACTKGLFQMCDKSAVNGETRSGGCQ